MTYHLTNNHWKRINDLVFQIAQENPRLNTKYGYDKLIDYLYHLQRIQSIENGKPNVNQFED